MTRFALPFSLFALAVSLLSFCTSVRGAPANTPQPRSSDGAATTNCGNKIALKIAGVNGARYSITATSAKTTRIRVGMFNTCLTDAKQCVVTGNYAALRPGENEIVVSFGDGACGEASLSTFMDK